MTLGNAAAAAQVRLIVCCKECGHQVEPGPAESQKVHMDVVRWHWINLYPSKTGNSSMLTMTGSCASPCSAGHRQQAVGDGAQGAAVAVAALAQRGITAAAERVVLGCQARPTRSASVCPGLKTFGFTDLAVGSQ
jgi:hypothetical protein